MKLQHIKDDFLLNFLRFWQGRERRERKMMAAGAAVTGLFLVYLIGIAPAYFGSSRLQKELPQLRQQVTSMQALTRQAQALNANTPPPATLSTRENIDAALAQRGIKAQSVMVSGDQIRLQFANVSFAAMLEWLNEMQKNARLTVIESSFTAQPQIDIVNATLTLRQPKTENTP